MADNAANRLDHPWYREAEAAIERAKRELDDAQRRTDNARREYHRLIGVASNRRFVLLGRSEVPHRHAGFEVTP